MLTISTDHAYILECNGAKTIVPIRKRNKGLVIPVTDPCCTRKDLKVYHLFLGLSRREAKQQISMVGSVERSQGSDENLPGRVAFQQVVQPLEGRRSLRGDLAQGYIATQVNECYHKVDHRRCTVVFCPVRHKHLPHEKHDNSLDLVPAGRRSSSDMAEHVQAIRRSNAMVPSCKVEGGERKKEEVRIVWLVMKAIRIARGNVAMSTLHSTAFRDEHLWGEGSRVKERRKRRSKQKEMRWSTIFTCGGHLSTELPLFLGG